MARTRWTLIVVALAVAGALAGCGEPPSRTPVSTGPMGPSPSAAAQSPAQSPVPDSPPPVQTAPPIGGPQAGASGITGVTVATPKCPVVTNESSCPGVPVTASFTVVNAATGTVVATVESGRDGRFRVAVAPGQYFLRTGGSIGVQGAAGLRPVTVAAGRYTTVTVPFNAGVR